MVHTGFLCLWNFRQKEENLKHWHWRRSCKRIAFKCSSTIWWMKFNKYRGKVSFKVKKSYLMAPCGSLVCSSFQRQETNWKHWNWMTFQSEQISWESLLQEIQAFIYNENELNIERNRYEIKLLTFLFITFPM